MYKPKIGLIPRYNWDFGFSDFVKAFSAAFNATPESCEVWERMFDHTPILTTSGRASLYAILKSLNLPPGSRVGVPLFCCPVVFEVVAQANLLATFIDINQQDYNISAQDLRKKRDSLAAVIVVHMFGHPADMDSISAASGDMPVIEDCAQSLFSTYKGKNTGFLSTASFFSFRSGKYISSGEGSAIFTKNPHLHAAISRLVQGFEDWRFFQEITHCTATYVKSTFYKRPWYGFVGYPLGMTLDKKLNLTAKSGLNLKKIAKSDRAILNDRIQNFRSRVEKQRENSLLFLKKTRLRNASLPRERNGCQSNYYQFAIRFENEKQRNLMADYLYTRGIDTAKYLDEVIDTVSEQFDYKGDCPIAEHCSKTTLIIPNHYTLSDRTLDYIVKTLNNGSHLMHA
jgi:dTDP-4-amino-4,6-dideoxygalactose transaminase